MQYKNIEGQRFGSLVAIRYHHTSVPSANSTKKGGLAFWVYKCDCGKEHIARANTITYETKRSISRGDMETPSCGCVDKARKLKHGYRKVKDTHPLYRAYRGIMSRCYNENDRNYRFYGARGVTICDEWKGNPVAFIEWGIANGWKRGLTIDKDILCEKLKIHPQVYSPDTCIFISQSKNTAFSHGRTRKGINSRLKLDWDKCKELYEQFLVHKYSSKQRFYIVMAEKYSCGVSTIAAAIKDYREYISK